MNRSIRSYLLTCLTIALLISSVFIAGFTYIIAGDEVDELYDKNMQQMAQTLLAQQNAQYVLPETDATHQQLKLNGEEEFLIRIWSNNNALLYTSHAAIAFPAQEAQGYSSVSYDDETWRNYSISNDSVTVQISQPQTERQNVIMEVAGKFLIPLLLEIPLLGFLIWWAVGKSLKPLDDISTDIEKRDSNSLDPITVTQMPSEVTPLINALNVLLEKLDSALKAQRQFTADAAHELRTPLTAVQLQLDLFKRSRSEQEKKEAISLLSSGVTRSIHVVRQLLALAHQDPDSKDQKIESFDLILLAHDIMHQCALLADQKEIDVTITHHQSPCALDGHKASIRILLEVLLDNALRYTPNGGRVIISVMQEQGSTALSVHDNGIGIPESERARVCDRFYRVSGTQQSGSGLGLAIAKRIAQKHRATVSFSDRLDGKGVSVDILFPTDNTASQ